MIRTLVVDDSLTVRRLIVDILEDAPDFVVVGEAADGREAVEMARKLRPDLITMDVHMPEMDGLEATREIMVHTPTPILVVSSSVNQQEVNLSLEATRAGALMVVRTPVNPNAEGFEEQRRELLDMARAMAGVKVVRRWTSGRERNAPPVRSLSYECGPVRLLGIAASTGGPAALQRILSALPVDYPIPILVVQHISSGFSAGLARWLALSCALRVKIAAHGEPILPGTVYLAPDDRHLGLGHDERIRLSGGPPIGGFRPAATYLFQSLATVFGARAAAVVLSGMGRDGVEGLRALHAAGGRVIAQDEQSSVVYGMPQAAVVAGVVDAVLSVQEIAAQVAAFAAGELDGV
jgi:two-component system, chemotaxis family, protein-glutamate methylesterase/glutaminase